METEGSEQQSLKEILFLLVCLLDTEDEETHRRIFQRILKLVPFGYHPLRFIDYVDDASQRLILRRQFGEILNDFKLRKDLEELVQGSEGNPDLESAAFLISRLGGDQNISPDDFKKELDALAAPLKHRLQEGGLKEADRLVIFRNYLFDEKGFRGNVENYYGPENSFLTVVLRKKYGIPVSLSVLSILVAKRAGVLLEGVNFPGHFLVRFVGADYTAYLDPFNEGNVLKEADCFSFLRRQGLDPLPEYLATAGSLVIMKRMYRNLINFYFSTGDKTMEKKLRQHFSILEKASIHN